MNIKAILAAASAALLLASCDNDGGEYHTTYFYPMDTNAITSYADQTLDSTRVVSTDSWTLNNATDWCTITCDGKSTPLTVTIPQGYMMSSLLLFNLTPNTTGSIRTNRIDIVSTYGKIGTISKSVAQYPFLNITTPAVKATTDNSTAGASTTTYTFNLNITAAGKTSSGATPTIAFTVYSNDATLTTTDDSWITLSKTSGFTRASAQSVEITASTNTTGAERTATLTLTSNGVSTPITITQAK